MMFHNHHGGAYRVDKRVPKMPKSEKVVSESGYVYRRGFNSLQRQLAKKRHIKKVRHFNRKLCEGDQTYGNKFE
ncbi:hypothetical protein D3C75_763500 [compost metagenome]